MSGIWAAVPVKEFAEAKQRLASVLSAKQRQLLAAAMFEDVLDALSAAPLAGIMVNTLDPVASELACRHGARVITTGARDGHSGAVAAMSRALTKAGAAGMLACPGDIPGVSAQEIAALLAAHEAAPSFTIVPAHDSRGSNAVLLSPPQLLPLRFGNDSFLPHLQMARRHGLAPAILRLPGFALDIDHPGDAQAFLHAGLGEHTRTVRMLRSFLDQE